MLEKLAFGGKKKVGSLPYTISPSGFYMDSTPICKRKDYTSILFLLNRNE